MDIQNIFLEIQEYCFENANAELVNKYSRYFKEGYDAFGLNTELLKTEVERIMLNTNFTINHIRLQRD
jgi:hypothetical protein